MTWAKLILLASLATFLTSLPLFAQTSIYSASATLAPTGTLRAAFLGDNPALGRVDPKTGTVTGPVADFVKELARRLGVAYTLYPATGTPEIIGRLNAQTADLGFFAYNAKRAMDVDFTPAWLLMPNSYIVRADSPIQKVADADRAGVRIAAVKNDTQDVYLSANLKNTRVDPIPAMPEPEEIEKLLTEGKLDAFAANRQRLFGFAARYPNLRVVADDYFVAGQAVAVAKGNATRLEALDKLLDEVLATSVVKDSIERAGLHGVNAAPPKGR
ncbi:MAG TPA: transporter substrate-binding domain-containing protein [Bryobacteraceae bacterium]|nr:transporter substrate-binding domain-containing protein [Bryobacteraceae bacterium]